MHFTSSSYSFRETTILISSKVCPIKNSSQVLVNADYANLLRENINPTKYNQRILLRASKESCYK